MQDRAKTGDAPRPGMAGLTRRLARGPQFGPADPDGDPGLLRPAAPVVVSVDSHGRDLAGRLAQGLAPAQPAAVLLFASPGGLLPRLAAQLRSALGDGCAVMGCSSAGEFALAGYQTQTVVAVGFPAASFRAAPLGACRRRN